MSQIEKLLTEIKTLSGEDQKELFNQIAVTVLPDRNTGNWENGDLDAKTCDCELKPAYEGEYPNGYWACWGCTKCCLLYIASTQKGGYCS